MMVGKLLILVLIEITDGTQRGNYIIHCSDMNIRVIALLILVKFLKIFVLPKMQTNFDGFDLLITQMANKLPFRTSKVEIFSASFLVGIVGIPVL